MTASWYAKAKEMQRNGMNCAEIGRVINRSTSRVNRVLNGSPQPFYDQVRREDSEETKRRRTLRRWCRNLAKNTGRSVHDVYEEYGCQDLDLAALWDKRRNKQ